MKYTYLFRVEYVDESCVNIQEAYHSVRAESFIEAVEVIETFYGNEIEKLEVTCIQDVFGLVSKETYSKLLMDLPFGENEDEFNEESEE